MTQDKRREELIRELRNIEIRQRYDDGIMFLTHNSAEVIADFILAKQSELAERVRKATTDRFRSRGKYKFDDLCDADKIRIMRNCINEINSILDEIKKG